MQFLKKVPQKKGLYLLTEVDPGFETQYLSVRDIEDRLYTDEVVRSLPFIANSHRHSAEWKMRQNNTVDLVNYVKESNFSNILDLGCGNGWLVHQLSKLSEIHLLGLDINLQELEQAVRLFDNSNVHFAYGDVFKSELPLGAFEMIVLNSCIQYFPDLTILIDRLQDLLSTHGEIHILDSPFYTSSTLSAAQQRSQQYYAQVGVPEMASHYYHHLRSSLDNYPIKVMYDPTSLKNKIKRKLHKELSPFPWIVIKKAMSLHA